jgi:ABC-type glycerol-3-phosphate transport system substrate-binding protein
MGGGKATLINRNSPHREEALKVLLFMAGPDYNRLINQEADAMAPVVKDATDANLFNAKYPNEDFQSVFRSAMKIARGEERSPFVDASSVEHIITTQLDLVRRDAKSAPDAMRTATQQIDQAIELGLRRDPVLRQRYEAATRQRASGAAH